jgi:hypothetical protein
LTQVEPPKQTVPQAPQLLSSSEVATQPPLQAVGDSAGQALQSFLLPEGAQ